MSQALLERLAARLGPAGLTTDPGVIAPHLCEWRGRFHGATPFMALPSSTDDVVAIVRICAEAGAAITLQGGNTGLVGGQIPQGEVLVCLKRMNAVRRIDPVDESITVEAGCILAQVHEAAAGAGAKFPLNLASEGSATIGGLVSTNAGGVHVVRYGMMRDLVLGLEVVLADGRVLELLSRLRKDNTGYDLKQLFIGAEGTLGVVTAANLKLAPAPAQRRLALVHVESPEAALVLLHAVKAGTGALSAFEFMNRQAIDFTLKNCPSVVDPAPGAPYEVLIELEGPASMALADMAEETLADALRQGLAVDAFIAQTEAQARAFWLLREQLSAGHRPEGEQVNHDVSVPVSAIPEFLARAASMTQAIAPGVRIVAFGHMGDGNVHYTLVAPQDRAAAPFPGAMLSQAVNEIVVALGGSISAEHGVGVSRRADFDLYKSKQAQSVMRTLKAALDPKGVLNPRVLL